MKVMGILVSLVMTTLFLSPLEADSGEHALSLTGPGTIKLTERKLPFRHDRCHACHVKKEKAVFPRQGRPVKEHGEIPSAHGSKQLSCHNCHDPNNSNYLRSTDEVRSDFRNSSPVCSTCHAIVFKDWLGGLHGKRLITADHVRQQLHCIDCHSPHSVTFKKMRAKSPPRKPKFLVEEAPGHEGHE